MMDMRNAAQAESIGRAAESVTSDGPVSRPFSEGRPDRRASSRRMRRSRHVLDNTVSTETDGAAEMPMPTAENGENTPDRCCGGGFLAGYSLAMAYFPDQEWDGIYEDDEAALKQGTLFAGLDFPFCPGCRR